MPMSIPLHIICGMCGSLDGYFDIGEPSEEDCGVNWICTNCSTLTSVEELNDWKKDVIESDAKWRKRREGK